MEPEAKRARNTGGSASSIYAPPISPAQSYDDDGIIWTDSDEIMGPDHVTEAEVLRQRAEQDAAAAMTGKDTAAMNVDTAEQDAAAAMAVENAMTGKETFAMNVDTAEQDTAAAMAVENAMTGDDAAANVITSSVGPAAQVFGACGYQIYTNVVVEVNPFYDGASPPEWIYPDAAQAED